MISPEEYIESRKQALFRYMGEYGVQAYQLDTETTSYQSLLRLFKGIKIRMQTADNLYQMARQITGVTIPVKGAKYEDWHEDLLNYIVDYKHKQKMNTRQIASITGLHENNYNIVTSGLKNVTGTTLYRYYENLRCYDQA
jgi:hypothetical protein